MAAVVHEIKALPKNNKGSPANDKQQINSDNQSRSASRSVPGAFDDSTTMT